MLEACLYFAVCGILVLTIFGLFISAIVCLGAVKQPWGFILSMICLWACMCVGYFTAEYDKTHSPQYKNQRENKKINKNYTDDDSDDFMNPLNPISPISPLNPSSPTSPFNL